jgi:hypothetical protein
MTQPANRPDPAGKTEDVLEADIERLLTENAALKELIEGLQSRIAELERRFGLDSSNSGKPPSSDRLKGPARAGIACCIKLEITPPSNSNHSRYGTRRAVVVG